MHVDSWPLAKDSPMIFGNIAVLFATIYNLRYNVEPEKKKSVCCFTKKKKELSYRKSYNWMGLSN